MRTCLLLILILLLVPVVSYAGYLSINGSPQLTVKADSNHVSITGRVSLQNRGNETAIDVYPVLRINGWNWAGKSTELKANGRNEWILSEENIPIDLLGSSQASPSENISFPDRGVYPLHILRFYRDQNGYQFSSPGIQTIDIGQISDAEQSARGINTFQAKLDFDKKSGQKFKGTLIVKNLSQQDHDLLLSFHTSQDLEIENQPDIHQIPAQKSKKIAVGVKNFSGLEGSTYDIFSILQWKQGDMRNTTYVRSSVQITEEKMSKLYLLGAVLVFALGAIGILSFLKRISSKK